MRITGCIDDMVQRVADISDSTEQQKIFSKQVQDAITAIAKVAAEAEENSTNNLQNTRKLADLSSHMLDLAIKFSGTKEMDSSKLWPSQGKMRGILPQLMEEFISTHYPASVIATVHAAMGNPEFLVTREYPDRILHQMVYETALATGEKEHAIFLQFGQFTIQAFYKMYKSYFTASNLKELYLAIENIHKKLTIDYPGITPPHFTYEQKDNVLIMKYHSKRGLFSYFEGILRGAADFMKEKISVSITVIDKETAKAEIRFL